MAKRKVNKSEAIRKELQANPSAKPQQIVEALKKKRISVTAAYVSTIKFTSRAYGRGKARQGQISVNDLRLAKDFAKKLGGVRAAREALDAWESLTAN